MPAARATSISGRMPSRSDHAFRRWTAESALEYRRRMRVSRNWLARTSQAMDAGERSWPSI
jgi:hypothetical protein